jgi:hydroxymethylpyrimidine pyrophosphatase-like HAD family hydrolase
MTDPARPLENHAIVFAVDCDRTLTGPDLQPDPEALRALAALRQTGIRCILVTGRSRKDLEPFDVGTSFDAFALEGGALWGPWNTLIRPANGDVALKAADRVSAAGIAVERRTTSFSVALADLPAVSELAGDCSLQINVDRVDVLPPRVDKGVGLDAALASLAARAAHVVAIGDAENDLAMFDRADVCLAVVNAVPLLKEHADEVLELPGPAAVVDAVRRLLKGDWRNPPAVPAAAA